MIKNNEIVDLQIIKALGAVFSTSFVADIDYKGQAHVRLTNKPAIKSVHGSENNNFPKLNLISLYFPGLYFLFFFFPELPIFTLNIFLFLGSQTLESVPTLSASFSQAFKS